MFKRLAIGLLLSLIASVASAQTCPTRPPGDSTNACADTKFVTDAVATGGLPTISNGQILANTSGGSAKPIGTPGTTWFDNAYCSTVGYLIVRFTSVWTCSQGMPINIEYFGASIAASAGTNDTAITAAIAAANANGSLLIAPKNGYNITNTIALGSNSLLCVGGSSDTVTGSFNMSSASNTIITIDGAGSNSIKDCHFNRAGGSPTGKGILVGSGFTTISDAACNTTTTITSVSQSNWTSANIGQSIAVFGCGPGGGPLFAAISSINNIHSIVVSVAASATASGQTSKYGVVPVEVLLDHVKVVNSNIGIHFQVAARFHVRDNYINSGNTGSEGMRIENQLSPDFGDSFSSHNTFLVSDNTAGYGIHYLSSGGFKDSESKFLSGKYGFYLDWNLGQSGNLMLDKPSIENCATSAIFISPAAQFNSLVIQGGFLNCGNPNIVFDNAAGAIVVGAVVSDNHCAGGGGTCLDIGKVNYAIVTGNNTTNGSANPAYNIRSTCLTCYVAENNAVSPTLSISNASTTTKIVDRNGMTSAQLPSVAAAGSQIFVSDGAPASACTGASTGSMAFRQNGAWKCF